jgi:hypothetical protein
MADEGVEIRLSTVGAEDIQRALAGITQQLEGMQKSTIAGTAAMKDSVSGLAGQFALLGTAILVSYEAIKQFVTKGVEANDMLEVSQIKLNIVLESLYKYPAAMDQHAAAARDAASQIAALKDRSLEVLGPLDSLLTLNQKLAPAMAAAGVATQQQATDFTILIAKMADVSGQSYEGVAMQISRMITTGQLARGEFAQLMRAMGVTPDVIKSWKEQGTTIDGQSVLITNLTGKLKAYAQGHKELLDTMTGAWTQAWKAMQGILRDALGPMSEEIKKLVLDFRDYILQNKDEVAAAFKTVFGVASDTVKIAFETISGIVKATMAAVGDVAGDSADNTAKRWTDAFANVGEIVLETYKVLAEAVLLVIKTVSDSVAPLLHPLEALGTALGAAAGQQALSGRAGLAPEGVLPVGTEGIVGATGAAAEDLAQGIADATAKGNQLVDTAGRLQKAMDDVAANTAKSVAALEAFKKSVATMPPSITDGQFDNILGTQSRVRVAPPVTPVKPQAIEQASKAIEEFQKRLEALGTGPATEAVNKVLAQFDSMNAKVDDLITKLSKEGVPPPVLKALGDYLRALAAIWEQAELERKFEDYRDKLTTGLADLNAKWQAAGSAEALYAQQAKDLASLDQTKKTMTDETAAIAETVDVLTNGLIPGWVFFATVMTNTVLPATDAAKERLLALSNLNIAEKTAEQEQNWQNYLDVVFQKNKLAGQNVVEAWDNALNATSGKMTASASTVEQGLAAGLEKFVASIGTVGKDVAAAVEKIGNSLTSTLSSTFFDVITGKTADLVNVFKKFGEDILHDLSDIFAKIVERWLLTVIGIEQNPLVAGVQGGGGGGLGQLGLGGSAPSNVGVNESGYMGGVPGSGISGIGAGVGGLGIGLGINTLSGAQTAGQYAGGAMEVVGGLGALALSGVLGAGISGAVSGAIGSVLGVAASEAVVPIVGWIAAIVTIIIGALIAAFSKPPEIKVPIHVGEEIANKATDALGAALWQYYSHTLGGLADVAIAGGGNVPAILQTLRGGVTPDEFFKSQQVTVHAGSKDDVQKDIEAYVKTYMPQAMLNFAFGREITGFTGQDSLTTPGVRGVPTFGNIDFTKPTAIVQMLQGLGFVNDKINEIAKQIDVRAPDDFIKWLTGYVTAVKGMEDATKKIGRSYEEIVSDLDKAGKRTPAEIFAQPVQGLLDQAEALKVLTGDDQIAKADQYVQNVQQLIQQEEQAVTQLHQMATAIQDQATALHDAVTKALQTPEGQAAALAADMATQFQKLKDSTNPADVQAAWNKFLSDMTTTVNGLVARIQAIETLQKSIAAFMTAIAAGPAIDSTKNLFGSLAQNAGQISDLFTKFKAATGDQQVTYANQLFGLIQQRYAFETQEVQKIADMVKSIDQSVQDQIFGIQQKGRTPQEQAQALWDKITAAQAQISGAGSPEEVQRLVQQIQSWVGQLQGLPVIPGHEGDVSQLLVDTLTKAQKAADTALAAMSDKLKADLAGIPAQLQRVVDGLGTALTDAQTELTKDLGLLDDATTIATGKLTAFGNALTDEIQPLKDALQKVIDALTGAAAGIGKSTPDVPMPTESPGDGYQWVWDPTTGAWVKKKIPTNPVKSPGGDLGANVTAPALSPTGSALPPINIAVDVTSGVPEEIAKAVAASIIGPLQTWVVTALKRSNSDLLTTIRQYPALVSGKG